MSVLSTPIYVAALWAALRNGAVTFAVTPKNVAGVDRLRTFSKHLGWAAVLVGALLLSIPLHHDHLAIRSWALASVVVCLLPPAIWAGGLLRDRVQPHAAAAEVRAPNVVRPLPVEARTPNVVQPLPVEDTGPELVPAGPTRTTRVQEDPR
jgi:hypothetical protein